MILFSWRWFLISAILLFSLLNFSLTFSAQVPLEQMFNQTRKSLVKIYYEDQPGEGTGFLVSGDKGVCTVLTNRHVVEGNSPLYLLTVDEAEKPQTWKQSDEIKLSRTFRDYDLALVTFKSNSSKCNYPPLKLGNSDSLKDGDNIYICTLYFTQGRYTKQCFSRKVSYLTPKADEKGYQIYYDAPTQIGMSGSPVVNQDGEVVAVHGQGNNQINLGIPINFYSKAMGIKPPSPSPLITPKPIPDKPIKTSDNSHQNDWIWLLIFVVCLYLIIMRILFPKK